LTTLKSFCGYKPDIPATNALPAESTDTSFAAPGMPSKRH